MTRNLSFRGGVVDRTIASFVLSCVWFCNALFVMVCERASRLVLEIGSHPIIVRLVQTDPFGRDDCIDSPNLRRVST